MKKLTFFRKHINMITTGFIALVVMCCIASSCYFFFVRGNKNLDEQRVEEVYILKDEIVHTGYSHSGENEAN